MANTYILLPHSRSGEEKDGFWSDALKRHLESTPDRGIPIGSRQIMFEDFESDNLKSGLDYFLRNRYVKDINVKQAVVSVIDALVDTGDFEIRVIDNKGPGKKPQWIFLK